MVSASLGPAWNLEGSSGNALIIMDFRRSKMPPGVCESVNPELHMTTLLRSSEVVVEVTTGKAVLLKADRCPR